MNRPDYVGRSLHYYSSVGYNGTILVADSSPAAVHNLILKLSEKYKKKLKLIIVHYPDLKSPPTVLKALDLVTTPYSLWLGDDDFILPRALEKAGHLLDQDSETIAVNGKSVILLLDSPLYGEIVKIAPYRQLPIQAETAKERLSQLFSDYFPTLFGLHRTEVFRNCYQNAYDLPVLEFSGEYMIGAMGVLQGKIKSINELYLVRQEHEARHRGSSCKDWVISPELGFKETYTLFKERLSKTMAEKDKISVEDAEESVNTTFWSFLERAIAEDWNRKNLPRTFLQKVNLKAQKRIEELPHLKKILKRVFSYLGYQGGLNEISLASGASPYYSEMKQLQKVLAKSNQTSRF